MLRMNKRLERLRRPLRKHKKKLTRLKLPERRLRKRSNAFREIS